MVPRGKKCKEENCERKKVEIYSTEEKETDHDHEMKKVEKNL